jgi:pimeloyl-ACP methyl ester carboxylesterase
MTTKNSFPNGSAQIGFDVNGHGPTLILLHGAGQTRQNWHSVGYVEKLCGTNSVIAIDLPGVGESSAFAAGPILAVEKFIAGILQVADACGAKRFSLLGYSLGGFAALQIAAHTDRVDSLCIMSMPLKPAMSKSFILWADAYREKWEPVLAAYAAGKSIPADQKASIEAGLAGWITYLRSLPQWPPIDFEKVACPILWIAGSADPAIQDWLRESPRILSQNHVQVLLLDGFNHEQTFKAADQVVPPLIQFLASQECVSSK